MRALVQRVASAQVEVAGEVIGRIGRGLSVFLGVGKGDGSGEVLAMAEKVRHLRVFENERGRFDRSLLDVGGELLVVSQFTLYGDCRKGRRPSFTDAAPPEEASRLYDLFVQEMMGKGIRVATGRFGERMAVTLVNDGPVTLWLEVLPSADPSPSRG
jgi:D-tyrosyl-tRNA(Tyr) deacylase